jgi:hypothetical protein
MRIAFLLSAANAATWFAGMNPGVKLRSDMQSIDAYKMVMEKFLPNYLNIDFELPKEYTYEYNSFIGMDWRIEWTDIVYSMIDLHMDRVKFELTKDGYVKFDFPALEHWEITA